MFICFHEKLKNCELKNKNIPESLTIVMFLIVLIQIINVFFTFIFIIFYLN